MRELLRLPAGKHVVMTPDGPRGPRRQLKPGLVFLASRTGRAIVPTAFAASRGWSLRGSWTNLVIPKPFSTAFAITGDPIEVPPDAGREEIAVFESRVQGEMDRLAALAEEWSTSASKVPEASATHSKYIDLKHSHSPKDAVSEPCGVQTL